MLPDEHIAWKAASDGYKTESKVSNYGGIEQRWLLVFSEKAYQKEKQTCEKNWIKMEAEVKKVIWHLGNEIFGCVQDALSKGAELRKQYPDFLFDVQANAIMKYAGKGKPKEGETPRIVGYNLEIIAALDEETDSYLKSRICDIVGELATFIADDWTEILPYTYNSMQVIATSFHQLISSFLLLVP